MGLQSIKRTTYEVLEPASAFPEALPSRKRLSAALDALLVALILASTAAVVLATLPDMPSPLSRTLAVVQLSATVIFSVEYVLRLYAVTAGDNPRYRRPVTGRLRYAATPMELVDLAAIAPSYILLLTGSEVAAAALLLRLLRLLKLFRYSESLMVFARVFRDKAGQLAASFFVTGVLLVLASGVVYYCERGVQPEAFGSIPQTMWWGIITLTTVGYGDTSPVTPVGQMFGAVTAVVGIGLVALPSGILAGGFIEAFSASETDTIEPSPERCPHCGERM